MLNVSAQDRQLNNNPRPALRSVLSVLYNDDILDIILSFGDSENTSVNFGLCSSITNDILRATTHPWCNDISLPMRQAIFISEVTGRPNAIRGVGALFSVNHTFHNMTSARNARNRYHGIPCLDAISNVNNGLFLARTELQMRSIHNTDVKYLINTFGISQRSRPRLLMQRNWFEILDAMTVSIHNYERYRCFILHSDRILSHRSMMYSDLIDTLATQDARQVETYNFPLYAYLVSYLRTNGSSVINVCNVLDYYPLYAYLFRMMVTQRIIIRSDELDDDEACFYHTIKPVASFCRYIIEDSLVARLCEIGLCEIFSRYDAGQFLACTTTENDVSHHSRLVDGLGTDDDIYEQDPSIIHTSFHGDGIDYLISYQDALKQEYINDHRQSQRDEDTDEYGDYYFNDDLGTIYTGDDELEMAEVDYDLELHSDYIIGTYSRDCNYANELYYCRLMECSRNTFYVRLEQVEFIILQSKLQSDHRNRALFPNGYRATVYPGQFRAIIETEETLLWNDEQIQLFEVNQLCWELVDRRIRAHNVLSVILDAEMWRISISSIITLRELARGLGED